MWAVFALLSAVFAALTSILAKIGNAIAWIFKPLGWGNWQAAVARKNKKIYCNNITPTPQVL